MSAARAAVSRKVPGSGRIAAAFARAEAEGRAAFVPYLTAGDPGPDPVDASVPLDSSGPLAGRLDTSGLLAGPLDSGPLAGPLDTSGLLAIPLDSGPLAGPLDTVALARALERAGSDILELGVPFSDPIADGPVLQRAATRALAAGVRLETVFSMARRIREETSLALILFTYLNPLVRFGVARAAREARAAGFDGVLVTDLPPEEAPGYQPDLAAAGLDTIFLVSPTSPPERMRAAARLSSGFLYVVSRSGITGARNTLDPGLRETIRRARRAAPGLPRAVGFGISTPEAARQAAGLAEGVIVGSALVRASEEARKAGTSGEEAVERLAASLARACRRPRSTHGVAARI